MSIAAVKVSPRKLAKLRWEIQNIQDYLDGFESAMNGRSRSALLGDTAEYIIVRNFPLPDRYWPDYVDLLLIMDDYPAKPPIGLYVLNNRNEALIQQIRDQFNAFQDRAFHDAPAVQGYTWICYHYNGNSWRYREDNPKRGDNVRKFLASFFAELNK
jgi:hypothetical protein